jgi:hypothetical protein
MEKKSVSLFCFDIFFSSCSGQNQMGIRWMGMLNETRAQFNLVFMTVEKDRFFWSDLDVVQREYRN